MKKILLLAAAAFCCTQITHADVIYRETFRTMTNNATLNLVGWEGFVGPTATGNPLGSQLGISSLVGKPPLLTNINAGPSVGFPSNGFVRVTGGAPGSSNWVVFTSEYTVDTSLWDISTISFYGGSNTNPLGQMPGFRIAVQVGGNWFASDQLLTQTSAVTSDGAFSSPTFGAQLLTFNWTEAANAWRQLNFVPGSALSLSGSTLGADLPGGNITAFGLYSDPVFGAPARRFDTYEINANAIPEPTALTLALIAGAALLIRRRMV